MQTVHWMALINVIITGSFSFLVWKVSRQSFTLTKTLLEQQNKVEAVTGDVFRIKILSMANELKDAIGMQNFSLDSSILKKAPSHHGLSETEIGRYFNSEQIMMIIAIWELFNEYIDKYWKNKDGLWKSGFTEDADGANLIMQASVPYSDAIENYINKFNL